MPAYFIAAYDITDHEAFAGYNPGSLDVIMATLGRHGGKVLAIGVEAPWMGDDRRDTIIVLEFPSREAALAWHEDPDYLPARAIRLSATNHILATVLDGFQPPPA